MDFDYITLGMKAGFYNKPPFAGPVSEMIDKAKYPLKESNFRRLPDPTDRELRPSKSRRIPGQSFLTSLPVTLRPLTPPPFPQYIYPATTASL